MLPAHSRKHTRLYIKSIALILMSTQIWAKGGAGHFSFFNFYKGTNVKDTRPGTGNRASKNSAKKEKLKEKLEDSQPHHPDPALFPPLPWKGLQKKLLRLLVNIRKSLKTAPERPPFF